MTKTRNANIIFENIRIIMNESVVFMNSSSFNLFQLLLANSSANPTYLDGRSDKSASLSSSEISRSDIKIYICSLPRLSPLEISLISHKHLQFHFSHHHLYGLCKNFPGIRQIIRNLNFIRCDFFQSTDC